MARQKMFFIVCCLICLIQCSPSKDKDDTSDEYEIADPQQPKEQAVHTIEIKQMKFSPETLNAHKGDKVIWVNADIVEHDVTELSKKEWASSKLATGASWSMVVSKSEVYYCNLHVVMRGKIVVEGEEPPTVVESSMIPICR
jgi:plastocyanin